jgi:hypothetical protein
MGENQGVEAPSFLQQIEMLQQMVRYILFMVLIQQNIQNLYY